MGKPSNQRKESEAGKSPDHDRNMTELRSNTHLKDRMSYGVLIGPSNLSVFLVTSMTYYDILE